MYFSTNRLEINLLHSNTVATDILGVGNFAIKNGIPAVVAAPMFVEQVLIDRLRVGGKYKVICAVDFDTGRRFAMEKMRPLPKAALAADGFDILVSANRQEGDASNELRAVYNFIREVIDPMKEVRWTLGLRSRPNDTVLGFMPHLIKYPATFIRTDHNVGASDIPVETHLEDVEFIRKYIGSPIKICGGVTRDMIEKLGNKVSRFDVTFLEAKHLTQQTEPETKRPENDPKR